MLVQDLSELRDGPVHLVGQGLVRAVGLRDHRDARETQEEQTGCLLIFAGQGCGVSEDILTGGLHDRRQ